MKEFEGAFEVRAEGVVRLHQVADRGFIDFEERDRIGVDFLGPDDQGVARWKIHLKDEAQVISGELSSDEWDDLFTRNPPLTLTEPPSVHNSMCPRCPSVGISRGVCCP